VIEPAQKPKLLVRQPSKSRVNVQKMLSSVRSQHSQLSIKEVREQQEYDRLEKKFG
jgi:hypothetical protein